MVTVRTPDAALLIGLLNTRHLPDGVDALGGSGPDEWVADGQVDGGRSVFGGTPPPHPPSDGTEDLRRLREGVRVLTRTTGGTLPVGDTTLDEAVEVLRSRPVVLSLPDGTGGRPRLVPTGHAADRGAASIAAVVDALVCSCADGSFERVRTCASAQCQWGFWDASRNRSRRWCSMDGCGNRAKNRAYRARR